MGQNTKVLFLNVQILKSKINKGNESCAIRLTDDNNDKLYQETEIKSKECKSIYVILIQKCGETRQETTNLGKRLL